MSIENKIKDLIEKSIPEQSAGAMRDFIDSAKQSETHHKAALVRIDEIEKNLKSTQDSLLEAKGQLSEYVDIEVANKDLAERETKVQQREDRQELLLANQKLSVMKGYEERIDSLVGKVFGHPGVVISNQKNLRTPVDGGNGMAGFVQQDAVTDTESRTEYKS